MTIKPYLYRMAARTCVVLTVLAALGAPKKWR